MVQQMQAAIAALNLPHAASTVASQVTLSFGIACLQHAGTTPDATAIAPTPEALVDQADQALYKAKSQGRNRYHLSYLTA